MTVEKAFILSSSFLKDADNLRVLLRNPEGHIAS